MAVGGRIEGRKSADGLFYEIRQGDRVLQSIPVHEAMSDAKLARSIARNGWELL